MSQGETPKAGSGSRQALDCYVRDIRRYPLLTTTGEHRLAERTRRGEQDAWEQLVESNLRLVVKIAREFKHRGAPIDDLISEGNIGLMEAAHRFDPTRGVRFASYAAWWIRKYVLAACQRHVLQHSTPVTVAPSGSRGATRRSAHTERFRKLWKRVISFEEPRSSRGGLTVAHMLASGDPGPDERINDSQVTDVIHDVLDRLSERERTILQARYGLDGSPPRSLQEVGACLGCTREWVRQLEQRAIDRVRRLLENRHFRA